jgi:D-beta-D-heptose 7-phosphate kinase/D-beta-D-heptose 1-phosphate adenosyltransferase
MLRIKISRINKWKKKGYTIGVANGCFDMLHPGHKKLIKEAKKISDKLIILLNSDESVKKLKGKNRPIENITIRKKKLNSLKEVDEIITFKEKTPLKIIKKIKPNYLFKGNEYKINQISGKNFLKKTDAKIILIRMYKKYSTTQLIKINKINDSKIYK